MFYLRLNKIRIVKNREFIGKAEIQIMSFITGGEKNFPSLEKLFDSNDDSEKKKLLESAIEEVLDSRQLTPVYKIKNRHELLFGDTGYIVYKSKSIPEDFSWLLIGVELDKKTRRRATIIKEALKKSDESNLVSKFSKLSNASNPTMEAVTEIAKVIAEVMSNDKDDQIGMFLSSFIRVLDYPHGKRDKQGVPDITGNMFIDYTIFGVQ